MHARADRLRDPRRDRGETFPLGQVGSGAALSAQMQQLWTDFAKGEPLDWPVYDVSTDPYLLCDFWDGNGSR